jgi:hypothetical protein
MLKLVIAQISGQWFLTYWFFYVGLHCISIDLMHNDVSRLDACEECWS